MAQTRPPRASRAQRQCAICASAVLAVLLNAVFLPWSFAWRKATRPKFFDKKSPFDAVLEGEGQRKIWKTPTPEATFGGGPTSKLSQLPVVYEAFFVNDDDCDSAEEQLDYSSIQGRMVRVSSVDARWSRRHLNRKRVFVQGVHPDVPKREVEEFLQDVGPVERLRRDQDVRFGEVRFKSSNLAYDAKMDLDGSRLHGKVLRMELDCTTDKLNVVLVHGLNPITRWQDLKDFVQAVLPYDNAIEWCRIHQEFWTTARIRFSTAEEAKEAMKLHRTAMPGFPELVQVYPPYNHEAEPEEIRVSYFNKKATEEDLERYFQSHGDVKMVEMIAEELPPEFREAQAV